MFDLANEHKSEELVHFEIGEPDFDTPSHIVESGAEAARAGKTHYTSNAGLEGLRKAIAADLDRDVDPDSEVVVTSGAMEGLFLALLAVVNPGDEVLYPSPAWPNYESQVKMIGAKPVEIPLSADDGFNLDADRMIDAMTQETSVIILTSPSNPTGQVYDREAVEAVVDAATEQNAFVIADEVYKDLIYEGETATIGGYVSAPENVLTIGSVSKTYAMTGWRVGWLAGPKTVINEATKLHENTTACASSISQHAAIAALTGPREPVEEMKDAFDKRRQYVIDRIKEIPSISAAKPTGAFYVFLDMSQVADDSLKLAKRLLNEYEVVTAPGSGFGEGGEGHLRISYANSLDRLRLGFDRIEEYLSDEGYL